MCVSIRLYSKVVKHPTSRSVIDLAMGRTKQAIDKAPQVLCNLLKKHYAPSWSSSSDLFGAKQLSREKALKWHCDFLVDMLQVSQVWNKLDLQAGLASFDGQHEKLWTKEHGDDWLAAQAYALKLCLMEVRSSSERATSKMARQPDHMKKLIIAFRSCPKPSQEEDSPPPPPMELARTSSMSMSSQDLFAVFGALPASQEEEEAQEDLVVVVSDEEPAAADLVPPLEMVDDDDVVFVSYQDQKSGETVGLNKHGLVVQKSGAVGLNKPRHRITKKRPLSPEAQEVDGNTIADFDVMIEFWDFKLTNANSPQRTYLQAKFWVNDKKFCKLLVEITAKNTANHKNLIEDITKKLWAMTEKKAYSFNQLKTYCKAWKVDVLKP